MTNRVGRVGDKISFANKQKCLNFDMCQMNIEDTSN